MSQHEQGDPSPAVNRSSSVSAAATTDRANKSGGESTPGPSVSASANAVATAGGASGGGEAAVAVEGSPTLRKKLYQKQLRQTEAQLHDQLRQLAFVTNTDNPIAKPPVVTDGTFTL